MNQIIVDLKLQKLELLSQKHQHLVENKLWLFKPYPWQTKWWTSGLYHKQRLLKAGNQVGKTAASCVEFCYHLTGKYPEDWPGYRFRFPLTAWAMGVSGAQIKRVLQKRILGLENTEFPGKFSGGYIPTFLIDDKSIIRGVLKGSIQEISIKHETGGYSNLFFLSYEQGQNILMGDIVDLALIDEEPRDPLIYPQVITRTLSGDKGRGGMVILAFTPEYGMTELVYQFTQDLKPGQYIQNVTWADSPHLTTEKKEQMLAALPEHQRLMRSEGAIMMGSGLIYPISDSELYNEVPEMLPHWLRINAIDFGVRFCGLVFMALDSDADVLYIYDAILSENKLPRELSLIMRSRGDWIPWAWPADGHLPDRSSGLEQHKLYTECGVKMLDDHAQSDDGKLSVSSGIMRIWDRMRTGRLKVSKHLRCFFDEKALYHRKDGLVVKKNDHVLDAIRYGDTMLRYATTDMKRNRMMITPSYLPPRYK